MSPAFASAVLLYYVWHTLRNDFDLGGVQNGVTLRTLGTPPDNHLFELKCRVLNGEPDCSIPENPRNTWGSSFQCSRGTLCFIVATRGATNVVFSTSALLEAHIDARTLRATISTVVLPTGATHRLDVYEISAVRGFPQFQKRRDLEVCFDTVPAGAGKRCVQLHFMVPPFDLRMSVDEGPFLTSAVAISRPYERRRVRVQVRDLNLEDHVCIDYPAVTNGVVSNVPNSLNQLAMESQATAFFEWEDMPTLTSSWTYSLSDCFAATRCVGGKLGGVCPGGLWERAFTVKGKSMNATMVFGAHSESKNVRSRSTYTLMLPDYATDSAQLIVASQLGVPAFLDSMNLAIDQALKRGTPYSLQRLEPAFINCPLSTVAVYAILQKWRRNNDGNKFSKVLCHSF